MEELDALARFAHVDPPDPDLLGAVRRSLQNAKFPQAPPPARLATQPRSRTVRHSIVGLAAAFALVGAGVTVASAALHPPPASAASFLRQVARTAAGQPGGWPNARYWYAKSLYWQSTPTGAKTASRTRQVWIGHDGTGLIEDPSAGGVQRLSGHDDADNSGANTAGFGGYTQWSWDYLYQVAPNPTTLSVLLRSAVTPLAGQNHASVDSLVFDAVATLLTESPAPPALRSALYQVAGSLPGATLLGTATDSLGRAGTAVEYPGTNGWGRTRLIIDPTNGQLLERENLAGPGFNRMAPAGAVVYSSTWVTEGPANDLGVVPPTPAP